MQPLRNSDDQVMIWMPWAQQPHTYYALRLGDAVLATLHWPRHGAELVAARSAEGRWVFQQSQAPHARVNVWPADSSASTGVFEAGWGGGILRLANGPTFHWGRTRAHDRAEWVDQGPLMRFRRDAGAGPAVGYVTVEPAARGLPQLALLALLGWYLLHPQPADVVAAPLGRRRATTETLRPVPPGA